MTMLHMMLHVAPIRESLSATSMGAMKGLFTRVAMRVPHMAPQVALNRESLSAASMDTMKGLFTHVTTQVDAQVATLQEILVASRANVPITFLPIGFPVSGVETEGNYLLVFCCW